MNAVVVYESHWGNTAAVARAVAEGLGPEARALTTDEASTASIVTLPETMILTWLFLAIGFALGFIALFWLRRTGQLRPW